MKIHYIFIIGVALSLLFTSCGMQGEAESVVGQFIEENAVAPEKMLHREFKDLDSTKMVTDSLIDIMRQQAHPLYKSGIVYPEQRGDRMLYFLRMSYVYEGDTLRQTFYLDSQLQNVVSFK